LGLLGVTTADVGGIYNQVKQLSSQFGQGFDNAEFEADIQNALNSDDKAHKVLGNSFKSARSSLNRNGGGCSLHWSLCPNMCQVEYELKYKLNEIRGNKMKKYKQFTDEMVEKRDEIIHDLKGKAAEVYDWENEVTRTSLDLERLEDAFILELQNDFKQAGIVNDGLKALADGFSDLSAEFTALSVKIGKAHIDCEEQAPCMAVPVCKLHAASGSSCADIVNKNIDKRDGSSFNHANSGLYLISPAGLEPKVAICENDQMGGSFTVIQNRKNGTEDFERNWDDYKYGFGTVANLDAADCGEGEFWLGNEYIYAVQNKRDKTALRVSLSRHNGDKGVISYSNFKIAAERQKYQLQSADGFKDDECGVKVGNSLAGMNFGKQGYGRNDVAKTVHVGMKFSTPDQDNDQNKRANCAQQDRSGWWFNSCSAANLNGYYHGGKYTPEQTRTGEFDDGVLWNSWTNDKFEALTKTRMSIGQDKGFNTRLCGGFSDGGSDYATEGTPVQGGGNDGGYDDYYSYNY